MQRRKKSRATEHDSKFALNHWNAYSNIIPKVNSIQGGVCMKGNIYCDQPCPICGGKMLYDPRRSGCFCKDHPDIAAAKRFRVRFKKNGKTIQRRFSTIAQAEQFLNGIRFKEGDPGENLDPKDYQRDNPLGFANLVEKWLDLKAKGKISKSQLGNHRRNIGRAVEVFDNRNIKSITDGELEDFVYADHISANTGQPITDKTRAEIRSTLNSFFTWACRRERLPMPYIPHVSFELGWREYVNIDEQLAILDEVWRISKHNPRIWLGIHILAHNPIRPGELVKVREGDVFLDEQILMIRYPKEGSSRSSGKWAWLWEEEIEILQSLPRALPDVHLFRHVAGVSGVKAGEPFGPTQFNRWWKRACKNLGIQKNVCVYGGTKHTQMTAVKKVLSPEQIKRGGSQHATDKAMSRYLMAHSDDQAVYQGSLKELWEKASEKKKAEVIKIDKAK